VSYEYPELPESGQVEAMKLIERFKAQLETAAKLLVQNVILDFYCDIMPHIETDSWTNYRQAILIGLKNYGSNRVDMPHDFVAIRAAILAENREQIINDLNQDHLARIKELEAQIERMYQRQF
jgi:hypothetical protein